MYWQVVVVCVLNQHFLLARALSGPLEIVNGNLATLFYARREFQASALLFRYLLFSSYFQGERETTLRQLSMYIINKSK